MGAITDLADRLRAERASTTAAAKKDWVWPTSSTRITTPPTRQHVAFDVGAVRSGREGDPIWSPVEGAVVEKVLWQPEGFGLNVRLRTPGGEEIILAHLRGVAPGIKPGARLTQGQLVGLMGSTGNSSAAHLHFEVRNKGGAKIDPGQFFLGGKDNRNLSGKLPPISTFRLANPQPLVPDQVVRADLKAPSVPPLTAFLRDPFGLFRNFGGLAPSDTPEGDLRVAQTPFGPITVPAPGKLVKTIVIFGAGSLVFVIGVGALLRQGAKQVAKSPLVDAATDFVPGVGTAKTVAKAIRKS